MANQSPDKDGAKVTAVSKRAQEREMDAFKHYIRERAQIEGGLIKDELSANQINDILSARTEEELEAAMEIQGLRGLRDVPNGTIIQINTFHVVPGSREEFANSLGVFAVIEGTMLTKTQLFGDVGTEVMLDTGVERIIAWLRAVESGQVPGLEFPLQRIVIKQPGGRGDMITLKRIPAAPVTATVEK